jgi:hypothetical protein
LIVSPGLLVMIALRSDTGAGIVRVADENGCRARWLGRRRQHDTGQRGRQQQVAAQRRRRALIKLLPSGPRSLLNGRQSTVFAARRYKPAIEK